MRDIPIGNGSFLVTFDEKYQIRDIYFPHVGQENHTNGYPFRFGIWKNGRFSWLFSDEWERSLSYLPDSLVTNVLLKNKSLQLEILCNDTVISDKNIFLRKIRILNADANSDIRVFLHHDFRILETKIGDCAFYEPETNSIVHYKKNRYFLIKTKPDFVSFAIGRKAFRNMEGTWRDAEDGNLHQNAIAEGSIDSTIQINLPESLEIYYWICAGKSLNEVQVLNKFVEVENPERLLEKNRIFWMNWIGGHGEGFADLPSKVVDLYKRSLLIIRTQIDNGGAILAANDSDVAERATDHYSYLWTRDGAFVAYALDLAGYRSLTSNFFWFCAKIVHPNGYFLQRYNPDGSVASSWHPFWDVHLKKPLAPLQEDETALVIWALWKHYEKYQDIEFVHTLYEPLIKRCADFMSDFQIARMKLPRSSWNLWEDRRGIHTFTVSSVIGALRASAKFASIFGENNRAERYEKTAEVFKEGLLEHLYCKKNGRFLRSLETYDDKSFKPDETVDSSLCGLFYFEVLPPQDEKLRRTMKAVEEKLWINTSVGGVARYENDEYMRVSKEVTGNAWILCTLWLADYYIALAESAEDLKKAIKILDWTGDHALPSGVLSEQIDPTNGKQLSVSPLTWSHSSFVATVQHYVRKFEQLKSKTSG
jgi:oligosaccharide amylase